MPNHDIESRIKALQLYYLDQLEEGMEELEKFYHSIQNRSMNSVDWLTLGERIHKLAGNGAMFGFPEISQTAKKLLTAIENGNYATSTTQLLLKNLLIACDAAQQLPREHAASYQTLSPPQEEEKTDLPLLLLIDDDESIWSIVKAIFSDITRVIVCSNTKDGLKLIHSHKPNVVLLDDLMPGFHGHQMIKQVKLITAVAKTPIIMLTSNNRPDQIRNCLSAGAVDYIVKPFTPESLRARVLEQLKNYNFPPEPPYQA